MREIKGILYTEAFRFTAGTVALEGDRIVSVTPCGEAELTPGERERYILPGLVDIHLHGCAGRDFCEGTAEAFRVMAAYELEHGVTTICPATMTLPEEQLGAVCASCAQAVRVETLSAGIALGDVIRGIYLEGPFIAAKKKGAQNAAYIRLPDAGLLSRLQAAADGMIRMVTIAPEMPGALDCIAENADAFHFSIAHTCADYDTARAAIRAGARHVTHLYNAMPPCLHREPGVVGAAAEAAEVTAELICDGQHLHDSTVRNTFRLFGPERLVLVSDSMMAAGMPDGTYALGGQAVTVRGPRAVLADGTLAGSVTDLYGCMLAAIRLGIPAEDAIRAATYNPACVAGLAGECGALRAGNRADFLITDRAFGLHAVYKSGIAATLS